MFEWCLLPDLSTNDIKFTVFHCNHFFLSSYLFWKHRMGLEEEGRCAASMLFVFYPKIHYSCNPNETIYNISWELLLSILLWVCEEKAFFSVPFLIIISSSLCDTEHVADLIEHSWSIFSMVWTPVVLFLFCFVLFWFFCEEKWWSELLPSLVGITVLPLRNSGYKIQNCLLAGSVLLFLGRLLS